jgi:hypothetical protein
MGYLIGTDEAGYGPNIGPLVISATVWEVPDGVRGESLFEHLRHIVACADCNIDGPADSRIVMADSKLLYTAGNGLGRLELGLWAALGAIGQRPTTWREVWPMLAPASHAIISSAPWYADFDTAVPLDCDAALVDSLATALKAGLAAVGTRIVTVRSRVIFEEEFNDLVERHGSKGAALSQETLALAAGLVESLPEASISVICDKHGGRNFYGQLLAEHFPEWLVEVHGEGRERSLYRFGPPQRRVEFCFRTRAEACLPVALASMASKYLRELAMRAVNDYWRRRVPGLLPTAGYPHDAHRFRADIAETQRRLQIADRMVWRVK